MRVFVTGASGHIGSAVVAELIRNGHEVVGLARSEDSAGKVRALGAEPLRGSVHDLEVLGKGAGEADGVVHLAYDHDKFAVGDLVSPAETDVKVVEAFGDALAGTGKPLLVIAGKAGAQVSSNPRFMVGAAVEKLGGRGLRHVCVAIPPVVHSERDTHGFLPQMIEIARRQGVSAYVGEGANRWAAAHTLDVARLYALALEKAPAGAQLVAAAEEGVSTREIAEVIGRRLNLPVRSAPAEDFAPFPFPAYDSPMSDDGTRALIGWQPTGPTVLEDLAQDHYFTR
jgi:nucleoside-diphosphate-sugar epimerase